MKLDVSAFAFVALVATATQSLAEQPNLQTPSPVIYLADNLDEVDRLGWCIDTLGRGFAERLQAHSCKPQGGDVQFSMNAQTGQIQSVEYPEYCMAHRPSDESTFALVTCDTTATDQQFVYDPEERTIRTIADETTCVSVGENSRSAGPFMSRTLLLTDCATTNGAFKEWVALQ
ncbi:ricin-type beta-trefoil lectin domain protein [Cognatiyoonia sp. IB215446]|uniref:ricin-type beta-trefoil lectin domain protein n=1 Tax=Cognatiyoonia sp. IB215446 TaxID=3097355 RepID=UPI002A0C3605|nr:ricin-type beta-trefoil lectin domain protein [Cognatiyoonia sp. IB215446]MDX8347968.1 ricin-type beta-trefoil lectin domain protein [Cognatiyoonia sp. IB215446]